MSGHAPGQPAAAADTAAPIEVDPRPFDLAPRAAAGAPLAGAAVLCIHGLTGTPWEVRSIGEAAAGQGARARGPLLPGHGETPAALAARSHRDWLDCVREEYARLRAEHERVFVAGLSLGGLLALSLAAEQPLPAAAVIGTPLRFGLPVRIAVRIGRLLGLELPKRSGSDIADPVARARHPGYAVMPFAAVRELLRLQRHVAATIGRVRGPLLVAHGRLDRTADPRDLEAIARAVGSEEVERRLFERSGHVVPVDHDAAALADAVVGFFGRPR